MQGIRQFNVSIFVVGERVFVSVQTIFLQVENIIFKMLCCRIFKVVLITSF